MKSLCLTLTLLLLLNVCCEANYVGGMMAKCCGEVSTQRIPPKFISVITKTDSLCANKAFIFQTVAGREVCYSQSFPWAKNVYNLLHNIKDSPQ